MRITKKLAYLLLGITGSCLAGPLKVNNQSGQTLYIQYKARSTHYQYSQLAAGQSQDWGGNEPIYSVRLYKDQSHLFSITTVQYSGHHLGFRPDPPFCTAPYECNLKVSGEQAQLTIHLGT